jgi:PAS domain S-box-containing protein
MGEMTSPLCVMDRFDLEETRMNTRSDVSQSNLPPQTSEELLQSLADAERQIAHLRTLQEISRKLNSKLSLEDLLTSILDEAIRAISAERGCLFLVDAATGELKVHLSRRLRSSVLNSESFQLSRTVIERVWRDGTPVITANALEHPILSKADSVIKHTLRSIMCVPLHQRGQRIGVLYLDNRLKVGQFQDDDLALTVAIADQAAIALQNAQLYQAAQQELAERVRAEEMLCESEERHRTLFEDSPISLWEENFSDVKRHIDGLRASGVRDFQAYFRDHPEEVAHCAAMVQIVDVNKATLELYQARSKEELIDDLNTVFGEETYDTFREELIAIAEGNTVFQSDAVTRTLGGDRNHVRLKWAVALGYEDTLSRVLVSIIDITDRVRMEERLQLLSSAVEQSSEGIAVSDLEGNLLFVNNAFAATHGYCPGELVGKHLSVFHTPEQMPSVEAANYQIQETGEFSGEIWHARRDGTVYPTLMHNSLLRDDKGNPIGMIGTVRDITQRVQAEGAIRRRNLELELLNQSSKAFSSTLDLDQVLATVLEKVRNLLGVTACSIWLVDPRTDELTCKQATEPHAGIVRGWRLAVGQGFVGWVAHTGESLIVPNVHADERHYEGVDHKTGLKIRSILSVPLQVKGDIKGVIQVVDEEPDRFSSADQRLVEALASSAAIAIENARLYARNREMAIEQERHRLERDLHDTVTQSLYGVGLAAQTSLRLLDQTHADSQLRSPIEHIQAVAQSALAQMREQLYDLHPTVLADSGLVGALARHCEMLQEQYPLVIKFTASQEPSLSASQREDLYYIAREALWNVVKHARAARVVVLLAGEDDCVELSIVDDGVGFDPSIVSRKQTLGLRNMRERTRQVAGSFDLESRPGQGTRITVRISIQSPEDPMASSS